MKYEYKRPVPCTKTFNQLVRFMKWLYNQGFTPKEISTLRWRGIDEYGNPPLVQVTRSRFGIKYKYKVEVTGHMAIWLKQAPWHGSYVFYKYLPVRQSKVAANRLGTLYSAKEIEDLVIEPVMGVKRVECSMPELRFENRIA